MTGTQAQVSLYPLRQESLSPTIEEVIQIFKEHSLRVEMGPMSTIISGEDETVFAALQKAYLQAAEHGQVVMTLTLSNACPVPPREKETMAYRAVGHVENSFDEPVSSELIRSEESRIVLDLALTDGLRGLEPGQKVAVLFDFHRSKEYELLQHPRGDVTRPKRGVFSLRSPHRPNPIGLCEVELIAMDGNILRVRGLDALNRTPVLDIKPIRCGNGSRG
jgi:tRNA-Thr(GGU) m(6)t(6)A37 methyltransferase TsaA